MKVEVHLLGGTRKVIDIDPSATRGATVGVNVWNQDGTLFVPASGGGGSGVSVTAWELILNIPPNVVALANTATAGLYTVTGAGTSATRTIQGTAGRTSVTNGSGVAGDPAVDLATLTDSGIGAALVRITRDAWGRVEGQAPAILFDLSDVDATGIADGYTLIWNDALSVWEVGAGGGGLTNPMTTLGDIITAAVGGAPKRLGIGATGDHLAVVAGEPAWQTQAYGNLVAGTNVTLTGTITNRLVGSGNVTISASGGGGGGSIFTPPPISGWSWVNQGAASLTSTADSQTISGGASGAGLSVRGRVRGLSPASNYSVTGYFEVAMPTKSFLTAGIGWRDSVSGRLIIACIQSNAANRFLQIYKADSPTSFNADYFVTGAVGWDRLWIRLRDDGTNRYVDVSVDGVEFVQMHSVLRTDFLTADQVGFFTSTENISAPNFAPIITLKSWA